MDNTVSFGHPFFGRDGNRVRADYFEYVRLGGEALGGGIGENSVCAGDPDGTGFMLAQMPKQVPELIRRSRSHRQER